MTKERKIAIELWQAMREKVSNGEIVNVKIVYSITCGKQKADIQVRVIGYIGDGKCTECPISIVFEGSAVWYQR